MYNTRTARRASRAPGIIAVVGLHAALLIAVLTLKRPDFAIIEPPLNVRTIPDTVVPPVETPAPPALPDDTSPRLAPLEFPIPTYVPDDVPPPGLDVRVTPNPAPAVIPMPGPSTGGTPTIEPKRPPLDVKTRALMPTRLDKPPYPSAAERLNEEGVSTVKACVSTRGVVTSAELVSSSGFDRLDRASIEWVKDLRGFKPATLNGKPVADCIVLPIEWKIEKR